jgi:tRNA(fMet)-specific endonuclease VapC
MSCSPHYARAVLRRSIITSVELYTGVYGHRDPKRAARELRVFLRVVKVLPVSHRVMLTTARLRHELLSVKAPIAHRAYDMIVAATALTHDLTLVTSNIRDYQDIPVLKLLHSRGAQR